MSETKLTRAELAQFTGSEQWYRHGLVRSILFTDGAKYVADKAGACWLLDEIALAQRFEKSGGEIAAALGNEAAEMAGPEAQQAEPEQDQAGLQEAQELAAAARQHEAAEKAQELEQVPELEQDGPER